LALNGITSNFTVTAVGANIVISNYNSTGEISYTVSGSGGSQAFLVNTAPVSVYINGNTTPAPIGDGWTYSNGEVTVTGATSQVTINFT
jgi:hypothetical protein